MEEKLIVPEFALVDGPRAAITDEPETGMVARVAWAIFRSGYHPDDDDDEVHKLWKLFHQDRAMAYTRARAAIDEMRECDSAMAEAGNALSEKWRPRPAPFEMIYNVMIEAALSTTQSPSVGAHEAPSTTGTGGPHDQ